MPCRITSDGIGHGGPKLRRTSDAFGEYLHTAAVWEWAADWYRWDAYAMLSEQGVVRNPRGPDDSSDPAEPHVPRRVHQCGAFLCTDQYCSRYLVGSRGKGEPSSGASHLGFRCVR
jgi:formylglycine-generating enzyme required for sulfatase activity